MTNIQVSAVPVSGYAVRVAVTIANAPAGSTMSVYRRDSGSVIPVLGGYRIAPISTVLDDPVVQLGRPATWIVTMSTGEQAESAPVTIPASYPVISDPYTGLWSEVALISISSEKAETRATVLEVDGRPDPVVVWDVESAPREEIRLLTLDRAQKDGLDLVLKTGGPWVLRIPCPNFRDAWWQITGGRSADRVTNTGVQWRHGLSAVVRLPNPRDDRRAKGDTLGDLHAVVPPIARWLPDPGVTSTVIYDDPATYEAWPTAATNAAGTTLAVWGSGANHYNVDRGRWARLYTTVWQVYPFADDGWTPCAVAAQPGGDTFIIMQMARSPYRAQTRLSNNAATPTDARDVVWADNGGSWTFPCGITWIDDGTPNGQVWALAYGDGGVLFSVSADLGVTWTPKPRIQHTFTGAPTYPDTAAGYSEAGLVQAGDGRLVCLVRRDTPASQGLLPSIHQWHSTDNGDTWVYKGVAVEGANSAPNPTRLADGTLIMIFRRWLAKEAWGVAQSWDNGETWHRAPWNDDWCMYGQVTQRLDGTVLAIGSTQERGSSTNAWIWSHPLTLQNTTRMGDLHTLYPDSLGQIATADLRGS